MADLFGPPDCGVISSSTGAKTVKSMEFDENAEEGHVDWECAK